MFYVRGRKKCNFTVEIKVKPDKRQCISCKCPKMITYLLHEVFWMCVAVFIL